MVWSLAVVFIALQAVFINLPRWLTTTVYVVMGWLALVAAKPMLTGLDPRALLFLAVGGMIYSIGGVIYTVKKPNLFKYFGYHELWHVFVLAGSLLHFRAMWYL